MAIDKAMIKRANARRAAARAAAKAKGGIEERGPVTRKRKKIEFYSGPAPLVFEGTMEIVDGTLKFDIEDKEFLFAVANGPPDVMNGDPERYYDFVIGQRMMSSTIIMKEVDDKPQEAKQPTEEEKSTESKQGKP